MFFYFFGINLTNKMAQKTSTQKFPHIMLSVSQRGNSDSSLFQDGNILLKKFCFRF